MILSHWPLCSSDINLHSNIINHVRNPIHIVIMEADPLHQIPKPKQTDDSIRNTAVNDVIDTKEYNIIIEVHYCRRFYLFLSDATHGADFVIPKYIVILHPKCHLNCYCVLQQNSILNTAQVHNMQLTSDERIRRFRTTRGNLGCIQQSL